MDRATVDHLLTTTRSVRRRLNLRRLVEPEVIQECLEIAIQAPNGGNQNRYHFLVVTDPVKRAAIGAIYKRTYREFVPTREHARSVQDSTDYLADHLSEVPVHIIACVEGRFEDAGGFWQSTRLGSILPAAWSLMLALRSRGLGAAWTTLHLLQEKEVASLLGIPADITPAVLLPVAYYTGTDFRPGPRIPARERTYWDVWDRTARHL